MGGSENQLQGPDFTTGVEASSLKDGAMLLGHANGEAILMARSAGTVYAVGATCTHYGGPLVEGLLVGDTVRCPWHHACFSLRTGEPLRPPALNPLSCWNVEEREGRLFVTGKAERDALAPTAVARASGARMPERIVIVGAGAAGTVATETLRREGYQGRLTVLDDDPAAPVDRPNLSKDYLAGNAPEEWIPLRPEGFHAEHGIEIVRDTATRLNVEKRRVERLGGDALPYDALLLATGAEPIHLPLAGSEMPHVRYLRSLADSRAIIARALGAKRAVVIGSSFIGLEVAASLRARGLEVHVVAPETIPLERVLGADLGRFVKALHEEKGVHFHLGTTPDHIEAEYVALKNGERLPAELVVLGVGVRPRVALAQDAGLAVDNGVVVNEYLETSAAGVYAAGDIARWPDPHTGARIRVEHWVLAERQGQTAARNMLGVRERFDAVPFFWSAHYDVTINYVGHGRAGDLASVDGDPARRDVAVRFERDGHMDALATIFRDGESLAAEVAMERDPRR